MKRILVSSISKRKLGDAMANVTVWLFDNNHARALVAGAGLLRRGTRAALERDGLIRLEDSALEVDERFVNEEGYTRRDYLTFRIRVAHSSAYGGRARDGVNLQLMAGEYDARLTLREVNALIGAEDYLQVVNADQRPQGGDLWVKISDYVELERFPDELPKQCMTVLGQRVTAADEWPGT